MGLILLGVVLILLVGALPRWEHSRHWGYAPSASVGVVLLILLALLVMGYLPRNF